MEIAVALIIWITYVMVTFVNVWCMGAMFVVLLDGAVGDRLENATLRSEMEARRSRFRYIKGGKDDPGV